MVANFATPGILDIAKSQEIPLECTENRSKGVAKAAKIQVAS